MSISVDAALAQLPFTRLAHFTPARNLYGILMDGNIRSASDLATDAHGRFVATDRQRLDGQLAHVCCSFEFPNAYYQARAETKTHLINFPNWVCLMLDRNLVLRDGAMFCPCNSATAGGSFQEIGGQGLLNCWANPSIPAGRPRSSRHNPACPTDVQAEALIPGPIPLSAVSAIVTPTAAVARELYAFLDSTGAQPGRVPWRYSSTMFSKFHLRDAIQQGRTVIETPWTAEEDEQ